MPQYVAQQVDDMETLENHDEDLVFTDRNGTIIADNDDIYMMADATAGVDNYDNCFDKYNISGDNGSKFAITRSLIPLHTRQYSISLHTTQRTITVMIMLI